jgi:hypothetical protein
MLTSPATTWPVYIDPTFHWHFPTVAAPAFDQTKQGSPGNGQTEYDNTSSGDDSGLLGAGLQDFGGGCDGDYHSYYQWKLPSVIDGAVTASTIIVPVGSDGKIHIYNRSSTPTDIVGDVYGYFTAGTGGQYYHPVDTTRIVDSRDADPLAAKSSTTISAPASIGVTDATLVLNITATGTAANGFFQAYPSSVTSTPLASILDWDQGQTIANLALVNTATNNSFILSNESSGSANYVIDISGYFQ